jgi:hypothetical protein
MNAEVFLYKMAYYVHITYTHLPACFKSSLDDWASLLRYPTQCKSMQIVVIMYCIGNSDQKELINMQQKCKFFPKHFPSTVGWICRFGPHQYGGLKRKKRGNRFLNFFWQYGGLNSRLWASRQVLYHLTNPFNPFCLVLLLDRVSQFFPGLIWFSYICLSSS